MESGNTTDSTAALNEVAADQSGQSNRRAAKTRTPRENEAYKPEDLGVGTLHLYDMSKGDTIKKFQTNSSDVGSPEVQIALLTRRLESLATHFAGHPQDHHSRRGMMDIISRRKRLLAYLRKENVNRYRSTIASLGLRK